MEGWRGGGMEEWRNGGVKREREKENKERGKERDGPTYWLHALLFDGSLDELGVSGGR